VLDFHREIIGRVISRFREISDEGIAELTVSPFYHPILPILIDSACAELADPHVELPPFRISFPEDARHQIREAREYFQNIFGVTPGGMWPSEGSVSEDTFELMIKEGFRYTFTDELILSKSNTYNFYRENDGLPDKPEVLYQPYRYKNQDLHIFFRDHYLSDLIGFVYKKWDPEIAAMHLIDKFLTIRNKILKRGYNPDDYIVSLIFDGENPWEYYHNHGIDFLGALLKNLNQADELNVTTYRDFMDGRKSRDFPILESVKPGSWIDGTFRIWFGHQEDFSAWKHIYDLKNTINNMDIDPTISSNALEYIRIAEGSDWYWWYGDEHFTANLLEFDRLFRKNIKTAYKILNEDPPKDLEKEIFSKERLVQTIDGENLSLRVKSRITPVIDGRVTSYYEWIGGAKFAQSPVYGSMHRAGFGIIRSLHAGFDRKCFFVRIDFHDESLFENGIIGLKININGIDFDFEIDPPNKKVGMLKDDSRAFVEVAFDTIFEASIPLNILLEDERGTLKFFVIGTSEGVFEERWPESSEFIVEITGEDPAKEEWII
jgi:alpha-amylase/alpha-mannosidase (GH57 family)